MIEVKVFDFLGKIPQEVIIACSGNKNSMAVAEFLSRTNRQITLVHVDFKDEDSKDRVNFIKNSGKIYNMKVEIIQPPKEKENEYFDYYKNRELFTILTSYYPRYVITATNLEDVITNYILNSIKCNPKLIQYRSRNIIRPYINTAQDEFDHWIKSKRVGYFEDSKKRFQGQNEFINKHMLDNCYKINPNLSENILEIVNRDFNEFMNNRKKVDNAN